MTAVALASYVGQLLEIDAHYGSQRLEVDACTAHAFRQAADFQHLHPGAHGQPPQLRTIEFARLAKQQRFVGCHLSPKWTIRSVHGSVQLSTGCHTRETYSHGRRACSMRSASRYHAFSLGHRMESRTSSRSRRPCVCRLGRCRRGLRRHVRCLTKRATALIFGSSQHYSTILLMYICCMLYVHVGRAPSCFRII